MKTARLRAPSLLPFKGFSLLRGRPEAAEVEDWPILRAKSTGN
jgi:hypothetical protein